MSSNAHFREVFSVTGQDSSNTKRTYESAKARKLYRKYEEMGMQRSIRQLAENLKGTPDEVSTRQLMRYSGKYNWVERARQHDIEQIRLEDAIERKRFKELINETKADLEEDLILQNQIRERLQKDLKNPKIKGTSIANSFECYVNASMNLLKKAHRLYGQAWNIDPLVVNFVQQNNNVQQQNNQLNFLEKLKKNDD